MGKILTFGDEARSKILEGMIELEEAVTSTLGPKGRCVIIDKGDRHPKTTKDGVSVAHAINFTDKYKDIGASIIQEAAQKTNTLAGDGTTTATLLTTELCKAGNSLVTLKLDATDVKKGFDKACADVYDMLEKHKIIAEEKDIKHIATISANNDEEIGQKIYEAFTSIGDGGIVNCQPSFTRTGKTTVKFSNGLEWDKPYVTSRFVNQPNGTCLFEKPKYFVYGQRMKDLADFSAIFDVVKNPLVIVAPAYSDTFITDFIDRYSAGYINGTIIVPDGHDRDSKDYLEDLAIQLGATIFGEDKEMKSIDDFTLSDLGESESITLSDKSTSIVGAKGDPNAIMERADKLREEIEKGETSEEEPKSVYEIELLTNRIAKLVGGIATIYIGALSDIEAVEKKDRYDDAINAVQCAIKDGIIAGGGCGLLHVVKEVADNHTPLENPTQERGYQTFLKVLEMPARRIIASTGKDPGYWVEKIKESNNLKYGYNAKTETFSDDLYADGVVDPIKVTETALTYGTSIAGAFIISNCIVTSDNNNVNITPNDEVLDRNRGGFGI